MFLSHLFTFKINVSGTANLNADDLWKVATDITQWKKFDTQNIIYWIKLYGEIEAGTCVDIKPKGLFPSMRVFIIEMEKDMGKIFFQFQYFPFARKWDYEVTITPISENQSCMAYSMRKKTLFAPLFRLFSNKIIKNTSEAVKSYLKTAEEIHLEPSLPARRPPPPPLDG